MEIKISFGSASATGAKRKFTTYMWLAIMLTAGLSVKVSIDLAADRKLPADFESINDDIRFAAADVAELGVIAELPRIEDIWRKLSNASQQYGISIKAYTESDAEQLQLYKGPLKHWSGIAKGETKLVLYTLKTLQESVPIFLYEYKIEGDGILINFSVVGT